MCDAHVLNGDDLWLDTIVSSQYPSLFNRVICNQAKGRENVVGGCASQIDGVKGFLDEWTAERQKETRVREHMRIEANIEHQPCKHATISFAILCMH